MLRKEITIILCLKLVAIFILWKCCFSHPIDHTLTTQDIAARFF